MTTKKEKLVLLSDYYSKAAPYAEKAKKAYGSRGTKSEAHDASRTLTKILVEYVDKGGSLLLMSEAINMSYPALRRRVMTAEIEPLKKRPQSKSSESDYERVIKHLHEARQVSSLSYHQAIKEAYDSGISLNKLAKELGLKSAYPLYYGLNKARLMEGK